MRVLPAFAVIVKFFFDIAVIHYDAARRHHAGVKDGAGNVQSGLGIIFANSNPALGINVPLLCEL